MKKVLHHGISDTMCNVLSMLFMLSLIIPHHTSAQLMTNDNVAITITSGIQVTVNGDIQNQNNATISNNGTIDLSGNWINNSGNDCFGTSQGTVILNGGNQSIGGSSSTVFNNLSLEGTGTKSLLINTSTGGGYSSPGGVLSLGTRNLDLNRNILTVRNSIPAAITRSSGFIVSETPPASGYGIIKWEIGTSSAGNIYVFPFGNSSTSDYLPVNMEITTAGAGTGSISLSTYPTVTSTNPNNRPFPTGVSALSSIYSSLDNSSYVADRFWVFDARNYSSLPVSNLIFTYRESEWDASGGSTNVITESQLQSQYYDGNQWSYPPAGVVNTTANTVTVSAVQNYDYVWVLVGSTDPLPIELTDYKARVENKNVFNEWVTASEINNDYFTIQRSKDGILFETIGIVKGAGNSTNPLTYSYVDTQPYKGLSYYRLKQTDFDGRYSFSASVAVQISDDGLADLVVYPNPATNQLTLVFHSEGDSFYFLKLFDHTGKIVLQRTIPISAGTSQYPLDISFLAKGIYTLSLSRNEMGNKTLLVALQ